MVAWRECDARNTFATRYQEVDALWWSERDTVVLYEVKFTYLERMRLQAGRRQLGRAARAARAHPHVNSVRIRLVYIGDPEDRLLVGTDEIRANDVDADFGIVWISPEEVEWAARDLGLDLPANWREIGIPCVDAPYALVG